MDKKIATIQDVAAEAGVSTATVSRTLSKPSVVAEATREAVLAAVERTGYRINATASNLRRQRTGSAPHDPAWPAHSCSRLKSASANGTACPRQDESGLYSSKRALDHRVNLYDRAGKHLLQRSWFYEHRSDQWPLGSLKTQNPIGLNVRTAGSCMRGFRTPDGTRNPSPFQTFDNGGRNYRLKVA